MAKDGKFNLDGASPGHQIALLVLLRELFVMAANAQPNGAMSLSQLEAALVQEFDSQGKAIAAQAKSTAGFVLSGARARLNK